jgi:uncharacterized damage-inducible protein DinB
MSMSAALIAELTQEAETTRRVLERVPEDKLTWKPHWKSMSLGQLALHIAQTPGGVAEFITPAVVEVFDLPRPEARSRQELLTELEKSVGTARAKLAGWRDEDLHADWTMKNGAQTLLKMPRIAMIRSIMLNHWYHHRGELVVYLRLLDVPIPSVYGPTADENPFAPAGGDPATQPAH